MRARAHFFRVHAVLNVVDFLGRAPFAAFSRSVEDVNHVGDGARTKKMRSLADTKSLRAYKDVKSFT